MPSRQAYQVTWKASRHSDELIRGVRFAASYERAVAEAKAMIEREYCGRGELISVRLTEDWEA